jgi:outer membrane protein insertion porin family
MKRACWMLAIAWGIVTAVRSEEPVTVPVVREIVVRHAGPGKADEGFVRARIGARMAESLDLRQVGRDTRALLDTKVFTSVKAEVETAADGVRLIYTVRRKPILVAPVEIAGASEFGIEKLRDVVGLQAGDPVDEHDLSARALKVAEKYREKRYPDVRVDAAIEMADEAAGTARAKLTIHEGKRARIRDIAFTGQQAIGADDLWKVVEPRGWWNPTRWFDRRRYDAEQLEQYRLQLTAFCRGRGFLDASVSPPELRTDEDGIYVTYVVREGACYRFGDVVVTGITRFPTAEVRRAVGAASGAVAAAESVDAGGRALEDFYGNRGYINARVRTVLDPRPDQGVLNVRYEIAEGGLAYVRNIHIRNNTRTKDKVMRRELLMAPGDLYDRGKVRKSERRLMNLGYFSSVRSQPVDTEVAEQKDLVFDVEEKRTGQFMVGAGFSSIDNLMGFVELSQGNFDIAGWPHFTGAGQKLKLRAQWGESRRSYEVSFVEPWLFDEQLSMGLDGYITDRNYTDYDVERTGGAVSLSKPLPGPNRVQLRYEIESSRISDVSDTNEYYHADAPAETYSFVREQDRVLKSTVGLSLQHDTRDNAFIPSRGNRVSLFGNVTGGILGGNTDIYNVGFRTSHYLPLWFRHVFSLRTRYEVVDSYGRSDEVPIDERLFLGGGHTLRGFDYRDVGPKVRPMGAGAGDDRYRPVGGRSLAMASVEYTLPLVQGIRLGAFYDVGNAWREAFELDLADMASSAGLGVRLDVPGFPIRVDRAWVVHPDDDLTDEDPWVIWIGFDY